MPYNSFSTSIVQVNSQLCDGMSQCDRCSRNSACACFHLPGASNTGICTDRYAVTCSELVPCNPTTNHCSQSDHTCVHHPQCRDIPVCYPVPDYNKQFCQPMSSDTIGEVVAGGNGKGNGLNPLKGLRNVLIDKETDSLIICDTGRVVRWSRRSRTTQGEILIDNIACNGLTMDDQRYLYVSDNGKQEVRRYQWGDKIGTIVAGGNGQGKDLNQLSVPTCLFVDSQQNVYVSDNWNHRVQWPNELFVDALGTLYVVATSNNRVMRWPQGAKEGTVAVGGNGQGAEANQFNGPKGLSFDRHGNLYISDSNNHRVQRFSIE
ncbi:unnamed protein product [Rotaria socialis]|uniref:Uncharacterized protein n=2 Tax=Rotaria socialis TaxID=392032 RepID=A0A818FHQ9_9BILA|nr:unnamed protein product [Rotaria socialis]